MAEGGGGALVDLGCHIIDITRFLLGDFDRLLATSKTFIKERPKAKDSNEKTPVDVDDISWITAEMKNGAIGTLEMSRLAMGVNDEFRIEIHGSKGALRFNSMSPNWLEVFDDREKGEPIGGNKGFKLLETVQRYPKPAILPGPKFSIGWMRYHIASINDFVCRVNESK